MSISLDTASVEWPGESIHPGNSEALPIAAGVYVRQFASKACGARGFSTGTAAFEPHAVLPYHTHPFSEAITILRGEAQVAVDGRAYHLSEFDCIHVPAGVPHEVMNRLQDYPMMAFCAFASDTPCGEFVSNTFSVQERGLENPQCSEPEHITRFTQAERYELSPGADFRDLFAGRFGAVGICGGYGRFKPGASLPCHVHKFDESITIVEGKATCLVQGKQYLVSGYDTAFIPEGRPHRFLNESGNTMAMIWVYAGSEPERTLVDPGYCSGTILWPKAHD